MQVTCRDAHTKVWEELHIWVSTVLCEGFKRMQTHRLIRVNIPSIVRCWDAERREDKFPSLRNLSCGEKRLRERVGCSGQKALVSAGRQAEIQKGFRNPLSVSEEPGILQSATEKRPAPSWSAWGRAVKCFRGMLSDAA